VFNVVVYITDKLKTLNRFEAFTVFLLIPTINEASNAEVGQVIRVEKYFSFLKPNMASKNDA